MTRRTNSIWCPELLEYVFRFLDVKTLMKMRLVDHTCKDIAQRLLLDQFKECDEELTQLRRWRKVHIIDSAFIPNIRWHPRDISTETEETLVTTVNDLTSLLRYENKIWTPDEINRVMTFFVWENHYAFSTLTLSYLPRVGHVLEKLTRLNVADLSPSFLMLHQTATFLCKWLVLHEKMEPVVKRWVFLHKAKECCGGI